ncbi:MAG TPA: DUF2264 domain-containing protein [Anaerolineales bacterium]|nr:DUF2264 domain-containing protein [Anaerolineales bacterium]
MSDWLPALDYELSPYTGWTRAHWEAVLARLTYGFTLAAKPQGSPARALFPDDRCDRPDSVDGLEAFARIAVAWGAWLHNPSNSETLQFEGHEIHLAELLKQGLLDGTNANSPDTYWGDIDHMDQRIVENSNIAMALWLSRERVFDQMTEAERARVIDWLAQVDGKETWPDNWIFFPALSLAVRRRLGYPFSESDLDARLEQMAGFYRGNGWYADGTGNEFDLYNAWMFGFHYLMWAWIDGDRRPDHRQLVLERAQLFLENFPYFFGANGSYIAWGRSLTGRFAATVIFQMDHLLKITTSQAGLFRRIASGCLRYFVDHDFIDPEGHFARQGFHGDFPQAGESYMAPGSPLSACHALLALMFDADDPFWTEQEAPLPVERQDFDLAFSTPGFVLSGHRTTGQVLLLNSRSGHAADVPRSDYTPKYGKLAYSTHFPFNVARAGNSYAPDAMIALTHDGMSFGHRDVTRAGGAAPRSMWCAFEEEIGGQIQRLQVVVLLWQDLQVRLAYIWPTLAVRAVEAPGALGCADASVVKRCSDPGQGWEYAEADGRAIGIRRLLGYDGQCASAPFLDQPNLNLAYPHSEQPLVCETQPSAMPRAFAAVSLARPAPFDPEREFGRFGVQVENEYAFRVRFPEGETALVVLGNEPPLIKYPTSQ